MDVTVVSPCKVYNLFSRGEIFYDFRPIVGSPRWLTIFKFNQTLCVTFLLIGDYYCGVRKFGLSSVWCLGMETSFLSPKWCTNNAAKGNLLNCQCFLMMICIWKKV